MPKKSKSKIDDLDLNQDPLEFLDKVMHGQDPRELSEVYKLALDIDEFSEGQPDKADWEEMLLMIKRLCKYRVPSFSESTIAAKTLAEYVHPKRKSIEQTNIDRNAGRVTDLTKAEIKAFLTIYEKEF